MGKKSLKISYIALSIYNEASLALLPGVYKKKGKNELG